MEKKNTNYSLVISLAVVILFLIIVMCSKIMSLDGVTYTAVSGTVCCLSNRILVLGLHSAAKMMYVDLANGKRVEVPIIDIVYMPGKKIVLRKRSSPDQNGIIYTAAYYQSK